MRDCLAQALCFPDVDLQVDQAYLTEDVVKIPVQVNGKVKTVLEVEVGADEESVVAEALKQPQIQRLLEGKQIKKKIFVPKKIVNFIIG